MKKFFVYLLFTVFTLIACKHNKIIKGAALTQKDKIRIASLHLLEKDEQVYQFYSEYKKEVAGNFYSNKRLASYWIDENDKQKNKIEFAYYNDISKIDTVYNAGSTYCPYLMVTKHDGSNFKVCVDGKRYEISQFFNAAIELWMRSKKIKAQLHEKQ